jgi:septal ring factor EnvC (AmiA/AmiB activator)
MKVRTVMGAEKRNTRILIYLIFLLGIGLPGSPAQGNQMRSEQELKVLEEKIVRIKSDLKLGRQQENAIESELKELDRKISGLVGQQRHNREETEQLKTKKLQLEEEAKVLATKTQDVQDNLVSLVRTSYLLGQQDSIKLLLNQHDPSEIAVTLVMYRYIVRSRRSQFNLIREYQGEIRKKAREIDQRQVEIARLQEDLEINKLTLDNARELRQEKLGQVQSRLSSDQQKVHLYRLREVELRLLLENLQRREQLKKQSEILRVTTSQDKKVEPARASVPDTPSFKGGFGKNRGRLPMPAIARIQYRFGETKPESGLIWEGLMLNVQDGQDVRSIYNGQVIYSDWFRGYGQLLVIDHGDGYMSLYGHNQLLHVELGSAVDAGQVISSAGSTGGLAKPGLYFEIRHNGIPDDPLQWCRM